MEVGDKLSAGGLPDGAAQNVGRSGRRSPLTQGIEPWPQAGRRAYLDDAQPGRAGFGRAATFLVLH